MAEPLRVRVEPTGDVDVARFIVNRRLASPRPGDGGGSADSIARLLVRALLGINGVREVTVHTHEVTVRKSAESGWRTIGPAIQGRIFELLKG